MGLEVPLWGRSPKSRGPESYHGYTAFENSVCSYVPHTVNVDVFKLKTGSASDQPGAYHGVPALPARLRSLA